MALLGKQPSTQYKAAVHIDAVVLKILNNHSTAKPK
jgi:hypothetical protein